MKNILVILGVAFMLSACGGAIDQYDIRRAASYCGSVENIRSIQESAGTIYASCNDKPAKKLTSDTITITIK